ncbi:MAG TPA: hypothetical protein DCR96_17470 [Hyphomonas sp.]|nr:hypothetical protein [Hyphomonas sp.]
MAVDLFQTVVKRIRQYPLLKFARRAPRTIFHFEGAYPALQPLQRAILLRLTQSHSELAN